MKKKLLLTFTLLFTLLLSFTALAGDYDLAKGTGMEEFREAVAEGDRLFDEADILNEDREDGVEEALEKLEKKYDQTMAVVLVENRFKEDMDAYADYLYYEGGLGVGEDRDGVLLVIDFGSDRNAWIYAQGGAMRYVTDKAIEEIFYEHDGGLYELFSQGDYYGGLMRYCSSMEDLYAQGIQDGQYNYNPETGETDYYKKGRSVKLWHVIVAFLIAGIAALLPILNVKNRYAMKEEKRRAKFVNMAYRTTAAFAFVNVADTLVNKRTTHVPIPRDTGSGRSGGSGFGGGGSTMHSSGGGGHHTSGGMKF